MNIRQRENLLAWAKVVSVLKANSSDPSKFKNKHKILSKISSGTSVEKSLPRPSLPRLFNIASWLSTEPPAQASRKSFTVVGSLVFKSFAGHLTPSWLSDWTWDCATGFQRPCLPLPPTMSSLTRGVRWDVATSSSNCSYVAPWGRKFTGILVKGFEPEPPPETWHRFEASTSSPWQPPPPARPAVYQVSLPPWHLTLGLCPFLKKAFCTFIVKTIVHTSKMMLIGDIFRWTLR